MTLVQAIEAIARLQVGRLVGLGPLRLDEPHLIAVTQHRLGQLVDALDQHLQLVAIEDVRPAQRQEMEPRQVFAVIVLEILADGPAIRVGVRPLRLEGGGHAQALSATTFDDIKSVTRVSD